MSAAVPAPIPITQRPLHELSFRTHDGVDLFYRHWPAPRGPARGAIVMFHRGHEHSARMAHLVDELDLPDFDFFAWDARGHGRSPGARGDAPGIAHFGARRADVRRPRRRDARFRRRRHRRDRAERGRRAGRGMGARLRAAHPLHGARLARVQGQALRAVRAARARADVQAARQFLRQQLRQGEVPDARPGADRELRRRPADHAADLRPTCCSACTTPPSAIVADAQAIVVPTQLLVSGADWVVHHGPQHAFFDRLGAPVKESHVLPGFYHDTLGERDRAQAVARARSFLLRQFDEPLAPTRTCATPTTGGSRARNRHSRRRRCRRYRRAVSTGRDAREPAARRRAVGRRPAGPRDRLRFRQHARLRLPQPGARRHAARPR